MSRCVHFFKTFSFKNVKRTTWLYLRNRLTFNIGLDLKYNAKVVFSTFMVLFQPLHIKYRHATKLNVLQ